MEENADTPSRRIADDLRSDIVSGHLSPGGKLPAVRDLAARYGVSRNTAAKAVALLKTDGLITTRYGSGSYVRESHPIRRLGPERYARSKWQVTTVTTYTDDRGDSAATQQQGGQTQDVSLVPADDRTAAVLGIEPGDLVYERARVMTRDGVPTHTMTSYYRQVDVEGTSLVDPRPGIAGRSGGYQILTEQGLPPHEITEDLAARMPTADEVILLDLPAGEPVVELHRVTRTAEGQVIEYARGIHAASRFIWSYTYDIPD
ncbi:GntR family transcriptional regulator [Streptosporangium roseum]|uniref:Transcriptional regulator, GntR family n=1 Tax=Streptosporangium roseum (strain ATCC 12428 / DSM 43021 / JCM 3005 / KCTC 9067 / NCIMB 10171 / NRRL 2505 / NI 9100) TaxID=479432 RepID=D2BFW8_STRRD|nr:GntR family transcriptional regulator [Streptosporangium roseum]ACZ92020.1 putative transcriptional regulator, GntR family [Streptosporangium roseum DSM 43021]